MNYTQSDAYVTHAGTGQRMHQDTAPITTQVTADDLNLLIWSLMAILKQVGEPGVAFDADTPTSYTALLRALRAFRGTRVPSDYGAAGTGLVDDGPALQALLVSGLGAVIPAGRYRFDAPLVLDYSDPEYPDATYATTRMDVQGASLANTRLEFAGGDASAISLVGSGPALSQGVHGFDRLGGFTLYAAARNKVGTGLHLLRKAYSSVHDLAVEYFDRGVVMDGCLTSEVRNLFVRKCGDGLVLDDTTSFSRPNAIEFHRLTALNCTRSGIKGNVIGACVKFSGLTCEYNGRQDVEGDGGFVANLYGDNGTGSVLFSSGYFEGNAGGADISLTNPTAYLMTVVMESMTFNRISDERFTTSNIKLRNTGGGRIKLVLQGCGFLSTNEYVPSAARPFLDVDGACEVIDIGSTWSESTSMPTQMSAGTSLAGRVSAAGAAVSLPPGVTVSKISTGIYRVVHQVEFAKTPNGYVVIPVCNAASGGVFVERTTQANNSFDVVLRNGAGTLTDGDFSFTLTRVAA